MNTLPRAYSASIFLACWALGLAACDNASERQAREAREAEMALMSDTKQAQSELESRIVSKLRTRGDTVVISSEIISGIEVLPHVTAWKLSCGLLGVQIVMSYGPGEDDTATISLTRSRVSTERCLDLAPPLASKVRSILDQRGQ